MAGFADVLQNKVTLAISGTAASVAVLAGLVTHLDNLQSWYRTWSNEHQFHQTIKRPFPDPLTDANVAGWTSGRLELALLQIDGYLGRIKSGRNWIKLCLTTQAVFPNNASTQFNDRVELTESPIDRENKLFIRRRIDQIENERKEETDILRINDPFEKLLKRSQTQLLSKYKESEISLLDKAQLYLLRNAIYARHGRPFDTGKLAKYSNRMGWSAATPTYNPERVTPLEICNSFFLEELHPERELGAPGRGVLIRQPTSPLFPKFMASSLCTCLAQPKYGIACRKQPEGDRRAEYRRFVDLIVEFTEGNADQMEWTFIDESAVVPAELNPFKNHADRLYASALDFTVAVQAAFRARGLKFTLSDEQKQDAFWGVRLSFAPDTLRTMNGDPAFSHELSTQMCTAIRNSLELVGPYLPRTIEPLGSPPELSVDGLEIFRKPIDFGDLRIKLTMEYVQDHYGIPIVGIDFTPWMVVVHRSGNDNLKVAFETMLPASHAAPQSDAGRKNVEVNFAVHYLVDRDGTVYSLMNDFFIARHVTGLNRFAVGIANIGSDETSLTDAQVESNAKLIRFLKKKYNKIGWLVGHGEAAAFQTSSFWEEKKSDQPFGADPGPAYMAKLRAHVNELGLKSMP